jgi:hypothetical protein
MLALERRDTAWLRNQLLTPPAVEPRRATESVSSCARGFQDKNGRTERAWLRLTVVGDEDLGGRLLLDLHFIPGLLSGARAAFGRQHVLAHRPPLT